ncbi:hypothetical protein HY642_02760 [Candidatus Woesearchaeota archaeon]|nr:hypothetical protein [Candidatus Woesearchaeota archaeon]
MKQSNENKPSMVLVGCLPHDLLGPERLRYTLARLQPDAISVPYDKESAAHVNTRSWNDIDEFYALFQKRSLTQDRDWNNYVNHLLDSDGFDYRVAAQFCQRADIPLILHPGASTFSAHFGNPMVECIKATLRTQKHPKAPCIDGLATQDEKQYETRRELLRDGPDTGMMDSLEYVMDNELDTALANDLRKHVTKGKTLAHICDTASLLDDNKGRTLYSMLRDLNPERVLIYEGSLEMARSR